MAINRHPRTKTKLASAAKKTKWAPIWIIPKVFGIGKRKHPSEVNQHKRHWRRNRIKM